MIRNVCWAALAVSAACSGDLDDRVGRLEQRVGQLENGTKTAAVRPAPIPVRDDDPWIGAQRPEVTIVEAFEFACPYCAMLDPVMDELMQKYDGQPVKLVPKQFVVHPAVATEPALAVCAAHKLGAYDRYAEALWRRAWRNEGRLSLDQKALSHEALIALADELGLDRARFTSELEGNECRTKLQRDKADLVRAGVNATPSLFINGQPYRGARTVDALSQAIEQARKG